MCRPAWHNWRRDWNFGLLAKRREPQCPLHQGDWFRATRVVWEGFTCLSACSDVDQSMVRTISGSFFGPCPGWGDSLENFLPENAVCELKSYGGAGLRRVWPLRCSLNGTALTGGGTGLCPDSRQSLPV